MSKSKIKTEVHTHTMACAHAYATPHEMMVAAREKGIELLALTDHAPALPDGVHPWHFANLKALPHKADGLYIVRGAEVNLIDLEGGLDLDEGCLATLEWAICSIHSPCLAPGTVEQHTAAYIKVLENPYIDALGHSGTPAYSYDIDAVLTAAKRLDKCIELNDQTFSVRKGSIENCKAIARRAAALGVNIVISTDAHSTYQLGHTERAWALAMECGVREEQIINLNAERFLDYLCRRRGFDRARFESTEAGLR